MNNFGHFTVADEVIQGVNLQGKTAVVTGGHTGIGLYTTKVFAKTANALFALHLDTIAKQHNIRAFSVHPGPIPSSDLFAESAVGIKPAIAVHALRIIAKLMRGVHITELYNAIKKPDTPDAFKTIQQGASTSVWAATTHDLDNIGGLYLEDCHIAGNVADDINIPFGVRPHATAPEFAKRLWGASEELVGVEWECI
ncbi:MAG: hypothetical protein LBL41_02950 [Bifidobacteriaceae bacterium]|jgi:NAD(P)-dependent dehydrogenase (short-subunit alcohol dehydrogenase family)|nr:hypothetical protein [Bifidobacteriaceae bacterium]